MRPKFDERDEVIRQKSLNMLDRYMGPRVGDFVIFSDGVTRRISHMWDDGPQTSDSGSWYLGDGYCSFSGALFGVVPLNTLTDTHEKRDGRVWFFHHGHVQAHNGVECTIPFRVFKCSLPAPK